MNGRRTASLQKSYPYLKQAQPEQDKNYQARPAKFASGESAEVVGRRGVIKTRQDVLGWLIVQVVVILITFAQPRAILLADPKREIVEAHAEETIHKSRPGREQIDA